MPKDDRLHVVFAAAYIGPLELGGPRLADPSKTLLSTTILLSLTFEIEVVALNFDG